MRLRTRFFLLLTLLTPYICEADVPSSNSPDHKAVEAAQANAARELGKPVQLAIKTFNTEQGWAFIHATMLGADGQPFSYAGTEFAQAAEAGIKSTSYAALLQRTHDGKWHIVVERIGPTDLAWADWSQQYGAPPTLFGPIPK